MLTCTAEVTDRSVGFGMKKMLNVIAAYDLGPYV